ncbi:MAG: hypothetical protein F6J87_24910 [Spirulina sp. SIO3F2]|nr:hypothetical protein [Spirulina sp. SIO3F2]
MLTSEQLYTYARKYCIDQYNYWTEQYSKIQSNRGFSLQYSKRESQTFPRYLILNALQVGVESLDSNNLPDVPELLEKLEQIALECSDDAVENLVNEIELEAVEAERSKFVMYIRNLPQRDLQYIVPLPYKYYFDLESTTIFSQMCHRWSVDNSYDYYPLEHKPISNQETLLQFEFLDQNGRNILKKFFKGKKIKRVLVYCRYGNSYAADPLHESFSGEEVYWFDQTLEWMICSSYENAIAVCGHQLLNYLRNHLGHYSNLLYL